LGIGTIGYATAAAGVAHGAAAAVSHGAKDAVLHSLAEIGLEKAAEILAAKFGINIFKNLAHGLATSTGQGYEHEQEHAPAQYGVSPAVAAQNQANLEKKFQQAKMGFGGMSESQLDEKSTSQAQFRTMAAAAHNPKFAKKVGISPDVAREFHGADRKQNYKSLPKKAAEDASWGMAPESRGYTR
jgi:pyruvate dehydrogenase complex dehydrogenase (E1) component